jgi:hypothetical protein
MPQISIMSYSNVEFFGKKSAKNDKLFDEDDEYLLVHKDCDRGSLRSGYYILAKNSETVFVQNGGSYVQNEFLDELHRKGIHFTFEESVLDHMNIYVDSVDCKEYYEEMWGKLPLVGFTLKDIKTYEEVDYLNDLNWMDNLDEREHFLATYWVLMMAFLNGSEKGYLEIDY